MYFRKKYASVGGTNSKRNDNSINGLLILSGISYIRNKEKQNYIILKIIMMLIFVIYLIKLIKKK